MSSGQASSDFQHCVICQEAYVVGEEVSWSKILLNCNHAYHPACIREWLMRNAGCPCCRSSFIHPNDLKVYFCFGAKLAKARWMERKNQIIERRAQGEFCVEHGLIFPSQESGVCSDEEVDGEHAENSNQGDVPMEAGDIESPVPTNVDAGTGRDTDEGLTNFEPDNSRSTSIIVTQDDECFTTSTIGENQTQKVELMDKN
jgi:HRD ubiquitin ligase complex, ER membrane component